MSRSSFERMLIEVIRENEPISTSSLAVTLRTDNKEIYRVCRKLEDEGLLCSTLEQGRRLLFCVDHKAVLTAENYEDHEDHDLRSFYNKIRAWSLTDSERKS